MTSAARRHAGLRRAAHLLRAFWNLPVVAALPPSGARRVVAADVQRWVDVTSPDCPRRLALPYLLGRYREFRTLYYYRLKHGSLPGAVLASFLGFFYRGEQTLHLECSDIGPGLFVQHGFATIVAAARVGANCWVNQQVTIGFDSADARPTLGDNVSVGAGAKVLGAVTLGDRVRVGANAVVLTDVPAGCTAVGVPARILPPRSERGEEPGE